MPDFPQVRAFFDPATSTLTYAVWDPATRDAVLIDPVLDFDPPSGQLASRSVAEVLAFVAAEGLRVTWVLETHAHADHLSGAQLLRAQLGAPVAIGEKIRLVQAMFAPRFGLDATFPTDGSQWDRLLEAGELLEAGSLRVKVLPTPGHTPACSSYLIGDAVFTGDALFIEDQGTGRCDFPGGSSRDLYASVHGLLYTLPPGTRVFPGHDYQPNGRQLRYETSIGAEREANVQLAAATTFEEFVAFRDARDSTLGAPRLLLPSLQVNIAAGHLPAPGPDGVRRLALPLVVPVDVDLADRQERSRVRQSS